MSNCAVKNSVEDGQIWGEDKLPKVSSCAYQGIDFACN